MTSLLVWGAVILAAWVAGYLAGPRLSWPQAVAVAVAFGIVTGGLACVLDERRNE